MARVFVSHAGEDHECASQVHQWLVSERHEVFLDQDLSDGVPVGDEWERRLHERLRWADAVVCVVTTAAVASTWCSAEVGIALSRGSRVLPVRAEAGVVHPLLRSLQHVDLTVDFTVARAALVEELRRVDAEGGRGWPDNRSPFPGLRPLGVEDHRVFFGRSAEVDQLVELLRSPAERAERAMLLVVGPSGCGKSSLVRAGVLHVMAGEPGWLTLTPMLPGADPVAGLVRQLAATAQRLGLDWTVASVGQRLEDGGLTGLADELLLAARAKRLLVVVDQVEELLTQATPAARARFAQLLYPALGGPVQLVATLRPEFFDQLLLDADLAVLPTRAYPLRPLHREALRTVIEKPARVASIDLDEGLVDRLVEDTDNGEALPLLAFTLAQLATGLTRGGQLSSALYGQLGGVQGALARQADTALAEASAASGRRREQVIAGLLRLVTVDEQGRPTRWRVLRDELPAPVLQELDAFVDRRLLSTDTDQGSVVIGAAHEAFLSAWSPLAQAIQDNASALRARRAVEQAAIEWNNEGGPPVRLWERGQLAAAVTDTDAHIQRGDLITERVELSPTARAFLRASIRRDRLRRGRALTVLSVLLILAVIAAGFAVTQQHTAEQQRDLAVSRQVAGQALELRNTNPALAAQLGLAAYRLAPTTEARGSLLSIFATPYATRLTAHTGYVESVGFSPDGHILATGSDDRTVRLWDLGDPHHPTALSALTGHSDTVTSVAFSPDGHILATGSRDGTVRLWDLGDPHHPTTLSTLTGHTNTVTSVAFSPDGHILATGSDDGTVRLWDLSDPHHPTTLSTLTGHTNTVTSVAFSPDGHTLATGSRDGTVRLWDLSDPHHPTTLSTLTGHTNTVTSVAFSPDGHILATGSDDRTVRLWDLSDPHHPTTLSTLTGYPNTVNSVAFSRDGRTLATGSANDNVRLWDLSDPHHPTALGNLTGHTGPVTSVAFSPDGHTLATGSFDNTTRLWDLPGPVLSGHTSVVTSVAFSPDGHILATGSVDRTIRLWDLSDPHHPTTLSTLTGHTNTVTSVAFSPDGHTLATGSNDHTVRLWDLSDPHHPIALGAFTGDTNGVQFTNGVSSVAFSSAGRILAAGNADGTVWLWRLLGDPHHPTVLSTLTGRIDPVFSVAFSPDGHTLATGNFDDTVKLWGLGDPHHPTDLSTLTGHTSVVFSVAFSPDGRTLASSSTDHTVRLWDLNDPHHPTALSTLTGHTSGVFSVAFSPDGRTLATGSDDQTVRLWDLSDPHHPTALGTLTGVANAVNSVAFSPDGHTLATGSDDDTTRLWETNIDHAATRICSITPTIAKNEWNHYLPDLPYRPPCP